MIQEEPHLIMDVEHAAEQGMSDSSEPERMAVLKGLMKTDMGPA